MDPISSNDSFESVVRRTKSLESLSEEDYSSLYRTKDIYIVAFFMSRGLQWVGLEQIESTKVKNDRGRANSKRQLLIYFAFQNKDECEKLALHYYNGNRQNLNVNANSFVQSYLNVRSIITGPPF